MGIFRRCRFKRRTFFLIVFVKILIGALYMHYNASSLSRDLYLQAKELEDAKQSDQNDHDYGYNDQIENKDDDQNDGKSDNEQHGVLEKPDENSRQKRDQKVSNSTKTPNQRLKRLSLLMSHYNHRDDTRPKTCILRNFSDLYDQNRKFPLVQKSVSILVMVNVENETSIYAEIASIVHKTEPKFLKEILIFVYGPATLSASFVDFWDDLNYEKSLDFNIELVRRTLPITEARNHAVNIAQGKIVVFLHARLECLNHWLEPLISFIVPEPHPGGQQSDEMWNRVAVLGADETDYKTNKQIEHIPWHLVTVPEWSLVEVQLHELNTEVRKLREKDPFPASSPIRTPLFLWSMMAMSTSFYKHIGGYETVFKTTYTRSGEDVEFGSRVWRCGGEIYVIPCSKVTQSNQPNTNGENQLEKRKDMDYNMMVMAQNYGLDSHEMFKLWNKDFIHTIQPDMTVPKLEKQCPNMKSFTWFLDEMVPEMWKKENLIAMGTIKLQDSNFCIDNFDGFEPKMYSCHGLASQRFMYIKGRLQIQNVLRKCLEISAEEAERANEDHKIPIMKVRYCNDETVEPFSQWEYKTESGNFVHVKTGRCLGIEGGVTTGANLIVEKCQNLSVETQKWHINVL